LIALPASLSARGVQPLRLERRLRHVVGVKRRRWRNDGLTAGRHAGGSPDRVEFSPPAVTLQAALASVGRSQRHSFWGHGGSPSLVDAARMPITNF
jgi:hypothetical protein